MDEASMVEHLRKNGYTVIKSLSDLTYHETNVLLDRLILEGYKITKDSSYISKKE